MARRTVLRAYGALKTALRARILVEGRFASKCSLPSELIGNFLHHPFSFEQALGHFRHEPFKSEI